jgi:hypothetical protein
LSFSDDREFRTDADGNQQQVMWYDQLKTIKKGSIIYSVFGWTAPEELGGKLVRIANLKLLSDFYTSEFGDEFLYFRHQKHWQDRQYFPWEWNRLDAKEGFNPKDPEQVWGNEVPEGVWPADEAEAKAMYDAEMAEFGCPFQWLIA